MRSTFMGLEASKKGLFVQQSALYTTGHNISNANTEGYTRQRVNMQATSGYPHPGLNSPQYPGHLGTGVEAGSIQRMRDEFTDRQYRQETGKLGYWDSKLKSINEMEDILNEPSEFGINQAFTDFWKAFQDLSVQPTDSAARKVAVARAESLAEAFNYNYTQLETIQGNLGNEIAVSSQQINTLLEKIAMINDQVKALEPNGYVTNDLYDARDLLVDDLNKFIPVSIERIPSGALASDVAEGTLKITYQGVVLVEGNKYGQIDVMSTNELPIDGAIDADNKYDLFGKIILTEAYDRKDATAIAPAGVDKSYADLYTTHGGRGQLLALIDSYGHEAYNGTTGTYPEMMEELNLVAQTFVEVFNEAHAGGYDLNGVKVEGFFEDIGMPPAKTMIVKDEIIKNPNLIGAASREGEEGNGRWAMELSNLQYASITLGNTITVPGATNTININGDLRGFTFQSYYTGMIGDLAVKGDQAITSQFNSQTQMITVSNNRFAMNSVSLDEEMTNMITFQQAYNANARMITVVDETLDKIINGLGRAGL